jgi:hypothetical protein
MTTARLVFAGAALCLAALAAGCGGGDEEALKADADTPEAARYRRLDAPGEAPAAAVNAAAVAQPGPPTATPETPVR